MNYDVNDKLGKLLRQNVDRVPDASKDLRNRILRSIEEPVASADKSRIRLSLNWLAPSVAALSFLVFVTLSNQNMGPDVSELGGQSIAQTLETVSEDWEELENPPPPKNNYVDQEIDSWLAFADDISGYE